MLSYGFRSPNHPKFDPTIEPGLLSNTLGALGAYPRPWHARPTRMSVGACFWFQRWLQLPALACLLSVRQAPQWTPSSSGVQRTSACIQEGCVSRTLAYNWRLILDALQFPNVARHLVYFSIKCLRWGTQMSTIVAPTGQECGPASCKGGRSQHS